jgi:hypothetical protein
MEERVRAQKKNESKKWREEVKISIKDERRGEKIQDEREAKDQRKTSEEVTNDWGIKTARHTRASM